MPTSTSSGHCCPRCAQPYNNWSQHLRQHPACGDRSAGTVAEKAPLPTLKASAIEVTIAAEFQHDEVARDLMDMRYEQGLSEPDIVHVKGSAKRWNSEYASVVMLRLMNRGLLRPGVTLEDLKAAFAVNIFEGMMTKHQEFAAAKKDLPYIEPRVVHPDGDGKGEPIVSFDQAQLYFLRLKHDAAFRKKVVAKSDELKRGEKYHVLPEKLDDILDGVEARWHPHIHRPATPEEEHDVRVPQLEQVDDLELCNTLGTARGLHKQCGVQGSCLSLSAEERFAPENIMLLVLARASVYKKHGCALSVPACDLCACV